MFEIHLSGRQSRVDWGMILAIIGLMIIGVAFIYSAKPPSETAAWYNQFPVRQIIWYLMGAAAAVGVCLIDYHSLARWSMVAYWMAILLLIAVLLPHVGAYCNRPNSPSSLSFSSRRISSAGRRKNCASRQCSSRPLVSRCCRSC